MESSQNLESRRNMESEQNIESRRNIESTENIKSRRNMESTQDMQSLRNMESAQDMESRRNMESAQNIESPRNMKSAQDIEPRRNTESAQDIESPRHMDMSQIIECRRNMESSVNTDFTYNIELPSTSSGKFEGNYMFPTLTDYRSLEKYDDDSSSTFSITVEESTDDEYACLSCNSDIELDSINSVSDNSENIDNFADDEDSDGPQEVQQGLLIPLKNKTKPQHHTNHHQILDEIPQLTSPCSRSPNSTKMDGLEDIQNSKSQCALLFFEMPWKLFPHLNEEQRIHLTALGELNKDSRQIATDQHTIFVNNPNYLVEEQIAFETTENDKRILQQNMQPQKSGSEPTSKHCDTCACAIQSELSHTIEKACPQHRVEIFSEIGINNFPNLADELNYILETISIYEPDESYSECLRCLASNDVDDTQETVKLGAQSPLPSLSQSSIQDLMLQTVTIQNEPSKNLLPNSTDAVASSTEEIILQDAKSIYETTNTAINPMLNLNQPISRINTNNKFKQQSTKSTLQSTEASKNQLIPNSTDSSPVNKSEYQSTSNETYIKSKVYTNQKNTQLSVQSEVLKELFLQNSSSVNAIRYDEIQVPNTVAELPSTSKMSWKSSVKYNTDNAISKVLKEQQLRLKHNSKKLRVYTNKRNRLSSAQSKCQTPDKPIQDNVLTQAKVLPIQPEPRAEDFAQPQEPGPDDANLKKKFVIERSAFLVIPPEVTTTDTNANASETQTNAPSELNTNQGSKRVMILNSKNGTATMLTENPTVLNSTDDFSSLSKQTKASRSEPAPQAILKKGSKDLWVQNCVSATSSIRKEIEELSAQTEQLENNELQTENFANDSASAQNENKELNVQPKIRLSKKASKLLKKLQAAKARANALRIQKEQEQALLQKSKNENNKSGSSNEGAHAVTNTAAQGTEEVKKTSMRVKKKGKFFKRLARKVSKY